MPAPLLVTDVRPRVADVMTSPVVAGAPGYFALRGGADFARQSVRAVPVVDEEGKLCGVTGIEDFARSFISGLEL